MTHFNYGKFTRLQDITVSSKYLGWWPCTQDGSLGGDPDDAIDQSGQGNDIDSSIASAADATLWDVLPGYASFPDSASVSHRIAIPASLIGSAGTNPWDFGAGESALIMFRRSAVKGTGVTANSIIGSSWTNSVKGIRVTAGQDDGLYSLTLFGGGTNINIGDWGTDVDITGQDFDFIFAFDGAAQTVDVYIDGIIETGGTADYQAVDISQWTTNCGGSTADAQPFAFGGVTNVNAQRETYLRDINFLKWSGGLPSNIQDIVDWYSSSLYEPLSSTLLA